jgi:hypothetical protein
MNLHNRHTLLIYKDMVKLVRTVMDDKKKVAVLFMLRKEFETNKKIQDKDEIMKLKQNACKSIADLYLFYVKNTIKEDRHNPNKDNLL